MLLSRLKTTTTGINNLSLKFGLCKLLSTSTEYVVSDGRSVQTMKKEIKGSPQKLNLLARQITGLTAPEALVQMKFSPKRRSAVVSKTIQNAINLADIRYGIAPECLQVHQAFVGKGQFLRRMKIHGRGRSGIMHHPHSHLTVILREINPDNKPLNKHLTHKRRRQMLNAAKEQTTETAPEL